MIPTSKDSYQNADNTLWHPHMPFHSYTIMEGDYTTGYYFHWVAIHIGQSNIVLNTIWSHRKAHRIISTIAILPLCWYLVNVRWTDNIPSLHVPSESICVCANAIWSPYQLTATRIPTTPFRHYQIPFRSCPVNRKRLYHWIWFLLGHHTHKTV